MLLPDLLADRVRRDPSNPLLTHYGSATERTELSARTFANWVDKTANLIVEDDLGPGDRVRLDLLAERPGHWMTLVWVAAAWRAGVAVTDGDAELVVTGPGADGGAGSYACSLHPLGLALRGLGGGVRDFSSEALAQPDAWLGTGGTADDPAWAVAGRTLTAAELLGTDASDRRQLVVGEGDAFEVVTRALIAPVLGGGSVVVVDPAVTDGERARIAEVEL